MRALIRLLFVGLALLSCASAVSAQRQLYRSRVQFIERVRETPDTICYVFRLSEGTTRTVGRSYCVTREAFTNAGWIPYPGPMPDLSVLDAPQPQPTQPAPPTQPPPSSDPAGPLYATDFEAANLSDLNANGFVWAGYDGTNISSARAYSGARSLRFLYPAGGNGNSPEQRFALPNITPEIAVEFMLYIPANFRMVDYSHWENNKILSLWAGDYSTNRIVDTELTFEYVRQDDYTVIPRLSVAHGDGDAQKPGGRDHEDADRVLAPFWTRDHIGKWVRIRVHAKLDVHGFVRIWRDDVLVYELPDWNLWGTGGINRFEHGYLLGSANGDFAVQTEFHVDDFRVWTKDPGW